MLGWKVIPSQPQGVCSVLRQPGKDGCLSTELETGRPELEVETWVSPGGRGCGRCGCNPPSQERKELGCVFRDLTMQLGRSRRV